VTIPRHERDQHVAAQRQLTTLGGRSVRDDLAGPNLLAQLDQRTLVDRGVLIGAPELLDPVTVVLVQPGQRGLADMPAVGTGTFSSSPVPTSGAWGKSSGTLCRCMFDPMSARFASSCSRNGINAAAIETNCSGATSMKSIRSGGSSG
jgi:hypothetical protein